MPKKEHGLSGFDPTQNFGSFPASWAAFFSPIIRMMNRCLRLPAGYENNRPRCPVYPRRWTPLKKTVAHRCPVGCKPVIWFAEQGPSGRPASSPNASCGGLCRRTDPATGFVHWRGRAQPGPGPGEISLLMFEPFGKLDEEKKSLSSRNTSSSQIATAAGHCFVRL